MKRSRLLLVVIIVAVAALLGSMWLGEGPLWRWVMLEWQDTSGTDNFADLGSYDYRGQVLRHETDGRAFRASYWYLHNGFLRGYHVYRSGRLSRMTEWAPDGRVIVQKERIGDTDRFVVRYAPPWHWGVRDQTKPTAPWWGKE